MKQIKQNERGGVGYSFKIADGDLPNKAEIERYKQDNHRALASKGTTRRNLIRGYHNQIMSRMTLPNSFVSVLLGFSLFALVHTVYA